MRKIEVGFEVLYTGFEELETGFGELETCFMERETGFAELKTCFMELKIGFGEFETGFAELETGFMGHKTSFVDCETVFTIMLQDLQDLGIIEALTLLLSCCKHPVLPLSELGFIGLGDCRIITLYCHAASIPCCHCLNQDL